MAALAHTQTADSLAQQLHVALDKGLTAAQVEENQRKYGKNGAYQLNALRSAAMRADDGRSFSHLPGPDPTAGPPSALAACSAAGGAFAGAVGAHSRAV
jgi:hypothetical protein